MGAGREYRAQPQRRYTGLLLCMLLALAPLAHPQAQPPEQTEDARGLRTREFLGLGGMPDAAKAAEGGKIFTSTCGFCHGNDARGASAPDLLRSAVVLDDNRGELIGPTVHNGRPGKGMPAFASITPEQLADLAEYLHLQVELAANRGTYQTLNIVTGHAHAGEAYFQGDGKCVMCHSASGDLAHIGAKMKPAELQQAFLYPSTDSRMPVKVTVILGDGKQVSGTLKHLDDFYVALYDADGQYYSYPVEKGTEVHVEDKLLFHRQMLDKYTNQQMHDLTAYLVTLQ